MWRTISVMILSFLLSSSGWSDDQVRTWTSTSGKTIEASLISVQGTHVLLKTPAGQSMRIRLRGLSRDDQAYVRSTMKPAALKKRAKPKVRTRHVRQAYRTAKNRVELGGVKFKMAYTEHYVVLVDSGLPRDAADNAETVWEEMQLFLPELTNTFSDSSDQVALFFISDAYDYEKFGTWYRDDLAARGNAKRAGELKQLWNRASGISLELGEKAQETLESSA
ncbi:MAG: hypothetical protein AAF492_08495, partial [Verrucomicrobiota bacterium]